MRHERVYTAGTFDLFHAGHVAFLRRASQIGDVTVALNTDAFVERYKGRPPLIGYEDRKSVLAACRYVSAVLPQEVDSIKAQVVKVRPDYLAIGSDWARRDYYAQIGCSQDWLDAEGIILVYIPYTPGVSSSLIRKQLADAVA